MPEETNSDLLSLLERTRHEFCGESAPKFMGAGGNESVCEERDKKCDILIEKDSIRWTLFVSMFPPRTARLSVRRRCTDWTGKWN